MGPGSWTSGPQVAVSASLPSQPAGVGRLDWAALRMDKWMALPTPPLPVLSGSQVGSRGSRQSNQKHNKPLDWLRGEQVI